MAGRGLADQRDLASRRAAAPLTPAINRALGVQLVGGCDTWPGLSRAIVSAIAS